MRLADRRCVQPTFWEDSPWQSKEDMHSVLRKEHDPGSQAYHFQNISLTRLLSLSLSGSLCHIPNTSPVPAEKPSAAPFVPLAPTLPLLAGFLSAVALASAFKASFQRPWLWRRRRVTRRGTRTRRTDLQRHEGRTRDGGTTTRSKRHPDEELTKSFFGFHVSILCSNCLKTWEEGTGGNQFESYSPVYFI